MIQIQRPSILNESKEIILVLVISLEADIRNINMVGCDSYLYAPRFQNQYLSYEGLPYIQVFSHLPSPL